MKLIYSLAILLSLTTVAYSYPAELGGNDVPLWIQQQAPLRKAVVPATRHAQVGELIFSIALKYNLDPFMMLAIASIESDFRSESNFNKKTQYKGVFQIGKNEWSIWAPGNANIYSAKDNIEAATRMLARHAEWFQYEFGHKPTAGELYMIHQQGRGFFTKHILTNVKGNPYPGMDKTKAAEETCKTFMDGWTKEVDKRIEAFRLMTEIIGGNIP